MKKGLLFQLVLLLSPLCFAQDKKEALTKKEDPKSRFENLELFNKVLYLIESQYYRDVDPEVLIQGAIKGMIETLDPHSSFLPSDLFQKMESDTSGEFGGLGLEVTYKDGVLHVITPIDDTPAFKAGLKSKDRIVEIDHESTIGMSLEEAIKRMRGKPNTKISIGVYREGEEGVKYFQLMREVIKIKPVKSQLIEDKFGYVRLSQFQKDSAEYIEKAIIDLKEKSKASKSELKGLVFDLRANPGGLLDEAVLVSSLFLKDGIVVSTEGRDPNSKIIHYVQKKGFKELELPIVVLINGASASASEIVAGALQDYKRALVMGSRSFGKGSVQTVAKIDEKNGIKLTIAQYMTPKNRKIQAVGIVPDVDLDEIDANGMKTSKRKPMYLREVDLKNHLNAQIETEEEKQLRLKREKEERIERVKEFETQRAKDKEKTQDRADSVEPSEDYQVLQAVNFLKSFKVFKQMQTDN